MDPEIFLSDPVLGAVFLTYISGSGSYLDSFVAKEKSGKSLWVIN
jgi:hypothetical protein